MVDWSGGVFASCMPRVQLYVNTCNGWPQFALQHHWLLSINCHFLRLYSAAGRSIAAVSSAIEESDLYLFTYTGGSQRWLITVTVEVVIRKSINDTHGIACSLCDSCA